MNGLKLSTDTMAEDLLYMRSESGYTQSDVADILGVTRNAIINYEQGRRTPDIKTLIDIVELYGYKLEYKEK